MRSMFMIVVLTLGMIALIAPNVLAYSAYSGGGTSCATCHPSFSGIGDELHDLHNTFINSCLACHASIGDTPVTSKCAQCHQGPGVRLHHTNAPTAPNCTSSCHNGDPVPSGENFAPPLYGTASTDLTDPCADNLDNDGDLKADSADPNCNGVAVEGFSWTAFKSLFR